MTFGEDPARYDRARPGYPSALARDLAGLADVGPLSKVLEIGPGTGQATSALIATGAHVVAVELAPGLAAVLRGKFERASLDVIVAPFEQAQLPAHSFDAVMAFTAWHWLDPAVRLPKAVQALRGGGALVTVTTTHVAGGTAEFFAEMQRCYERWDPSTPPGLRLDAANELPAAVDEVDESDAFLPAVRRRYERDIEYSTNSYLDVLLTYSGHRTMPPAAQAGLLGCLASLIDRDFGGTIVKRYLYELRVARRSSPA